VAGARHALEPSLDAALVDHSHVVVVFQNDIRRASCGRSRAFLGGFARARIARHDEVVAARDELAPIAWALIAFEQDANLDEFVVAQGSDRLAVTRELVSLFVPESVNKLHDGPSSPQPAHCKGGRFFPMPESRTSTRASLAPPRRPDHRGDDAFVWSARSAAHHFCSAATSSRIAALARQAFARSLRRKAARRDRRRSRRHRAAELTRYAEPPIGTPAPSPVVSGRPATVTVFGSAVVAALHRGGVVAASRVGDASRSHGCGDDSERRASGDDRALPNRPRPKSRCLFARRGQRLTMLAIE